MKRYVIDFDVRVPVVAEFTAENEDAAWEQFYAIDPAKWLRAGSPALESADIINEGICDVTEDK